MPSLPLVPWNLATSEAYVRAETYAAVNTIQHVVAWNLHASTCRGARLVCPARWKLTWESAGAHRERLAWRRHWRAGAAKERAANMLRVSQCGYNPIEATLLLWKSSRWVGRRREGCAKLGYRKRKLHRPRDVFVRQTGTFRLRHGIPSAQRPAFTPAPSVNTMPLICSPCSWRIPTTTPA